MQKNLVQYNGPLIKSDDGASNSTVAMRDTTGGLAMTSTNTGAVNNTGGHTRSYRTVTTSTDTVLPTDDIIYCNRTGGVVLNLPAVAGSGGRDLTIKNIAASGTVTITPADGQIEGGATLALTTLQTAHINSDASNWFKI